MGSLLTSSRSQKLVAAAAIHVERAGARVRVVELQVHVSSIIVLGVSRHLLDGDGFLHFQIRSLDYQLSWL